MPAHWLHHTLVVVTVNQVVIMMVAVFLDSVEGNVAVPWRAERSAIFFKIFPMYPPP